MARIFAFLVLLIAAVYADSNSESKKREEASSAEVTSKGSEESATRERTEKEAVLAKKSGKGATAGDEEAHQGDYQKFMKQFGGDYSKHMGSGSDSSSQSSDWSKYMAQHGGQGNDFKQFMQKYTGGQGAGVMGGNYQQYLKQYAGDSMGAKGKKGGSASTPDFQQYTQQGDANPTVLAQAVDSKADAKHESKKTEDASSPEVAEESSKEAQQGDYQQFMKQFGGDYSKHMGSGSDSSSQSSDWSKYMAQHGGQGYDFKQFMQKYMGGQGAGVMGGNYQQYMKQYAGDSMGAQGKKGGSASTPDFQQYTQRGDANPTVLAQAVDSKADAKHESKKTEDASSPEVAEESRKEAQQGDYQQFMKQFGGDYSKYMGSGSDSSSQSSDWSKYMAQYSPQGGDFKQYVQKYTGGQGAGGMGGNYQQYMKQYAGDYMGAHGKRGESASMPDFPQYMQQADASPTVLLAETADSKADAKHDSKKTEDASTPEVAKKSSKEAAAGKGEAQPGDYQQFMKKQSDWNKYVAQYARGKKGESASTPDFQQYMQQRDAGPTVLPAEAADSKFDAKQESKKTEDASTPEAAERSSKEATTGKGEAQQEDHQKLMKQFGGDYSRYMGSGSDGSSGRNKYMAQYVKKGSDFKQYIQKYTSGQGAGGMGGNHQQYMKQYAGDYMGAQGKKGGIASTPDFKQYVQQADVGRTVLLA